MAAGASSIGHTVVGAASTGAVNTPLFHSACLFATGVILAHFLWMRPSLTLIALILIAALSAVAALRAPRIA